MPSFTRQYFNGKRETYRNEASTNPFNVLEGVAANAAESLRTVDVKLGANDKSLAAGWDLTHNVATAVTLTTFASYDGGLTYKQLYSRSIDTGVATNNAFSDSFAVSGDDSGTAIYSVDGATDARVIIAATGGDGSDLMNLQVAVAQ